VSPVNVFLGFLLFILKSESWWDEPSTEHVYGKMCLMMWVCLGSMKSLQKSMKWDTERSERSCFRDQKQEHGAKGFKLSNNRKCQLPLAAVITNHSFVDLHGHLLRYLGTHKRWFTKRKKNYLKLFFIYFGIAFIYFKK
jgi:hypothetical protein